MPGRKSYAGAAAASTLTGGINGTDLTFATVAANNWPTGTGAQPFVVVIDRGTGDEEKILCDSRSGTAFTVNVSGRGYDGTTGVSHLTGATVEHCLDADTLTEANAHVNDVIRDDHTQYHNTTRHAAVSHLIGTHLPAPPAPTAVGTSAGAGSSTSAARADHVHILGTGAVSSAAMLGTDVVTATQIAANAVGSSEIAADAVGSSEIAADAVGSSEIAAGAVGPSEIANDAIENQHISDAAIDDNDMIDDNVIRTNHISDNQITTAKILDANVTTAKIADANITTAKFATDAAPPIPHSSITNLVPTGAGNVSGNTYVDWPTAATGGPAEVAGFVKLRADTKILVAAGGAGWNVNATGHGYLVAVWDGTTNHEVVRWFSNDALGGFPRHHSGMVEIDSLAAGTYTFSLRLKTDATAGTTAWQTDGAQSWYISVTETL